MRRVSADFNNLTQDGLLAIFPVCFAESPKIDELLVVEDYSDDELRFTARVASISTNGTVRAKVDWDSQVTSKSYVTKTICVQELVR